MKKHIRIISLLLALVMAFGCLSFGAYAESGSAEGETAVSPSLDEVYAQHVVSGIISIEDLQTAVTNGDILYMKATTVTNTTNFGAGSNIQDAGGMMSYKNEDGNGVINFGNNTTATSDTYLDIPNKISRYVDTFKNLSTDYAGSAFVSSIDLRIDDLEVLQSGNTTIVLFDFRAYMDGTKLKAAQKTAAESGAEIASYAFATVKNTPVQITKNGDIYYAVPKGTGFEYVDSGHNLKEGEFATVSIFVRPKENKYNLYYDGVCIAKDIAFFSESQLAGMKWSATQAEIKKSTSTGLSTFDGGDITSNGAENYIPGFNRTFNALSAKYGCDGEGVCTIEGCDHDRIAFSADNLKMYFIDKNAAVYPECAKHEYGELEHTHDTTADTATVKLECENCGSAPSYTVKIDGDSDSKCDICVRNFNTGKTYTAREITELLGGYTAANDFSTTSKSGFTDNLGNAHFVTDALGNPHLQLGPYDTASTSTDTQFYYNLYSYGANKTNYLENLAKGQYRLGESFVAQYDIRLNQEINSTMNLMQFMCYNSFDGTSKQAGSTVNKYVIRLTNGVLEYVQPTTTGYSTTFEEWMDKSDNKYKYVSTGRKLNVGEYYTLTVHAEPAKNEYSVYLNGECLASGIRLMTPQDLSKLTYKYDNVTITSSDQSETVVVEGKGAESYVLNVLRLAHVYLKYTTPVLDIDNTLLYYPGETPTESGFDLKTLHDYTLSLSEAGNGYIDMNYTCACCDNTRTILAKGHVLNGDTAILGRSASLGDSIGFKLHLEVGEETLKDPDATVTVSVNEKAEEYKISDMTPQNGRYIIEIPLTSIEMSETITAQITTADGEGALYTTSFEDYAEALISSSDNDSLTALVKATLNYGAYAQDYFAKKNSAVFASAPEKYLSAELEALTDELEAYEITVSDLSSSTDALGATLVLDSTTSIKVFFNGGTSVTVDGEAAELLSSGTQTYVEIAGITPKLLANDCEIVLTASDGTVTVTLNTLTCAKLVVNSSETSDEFKALAKALYLYYSAATAYTE